jgi:hypothetical protein
VAVPYVPRAPAAGVLHDVVRRHLTTFLATVAARTDGAGVPGFVATEFRRFHAHDACFDLHADVTIAAWDRALNVDPPRARSAARPPRGRARPRC